MKRPSRGLRESATTIEKNGRCFAPPRASLILSAIPSPFEMSLRSAAEAAGQEAGEPVPLQALLPELGGPLHHVGHILMLLQEAVHLLDCGARAAGDASPARGVQDLGVL